MNASQTGTRFRGGNITSQAGPLLGDPESWASLQAGWTSADYWTSIVKWQIDLAAAAGLNTVRLVGDVGGIKAGTYTLAQAKANWVQMLDYCRSIGMHVYPCLADALHLQGATQSDLQTWLPALAAAIAPYPDVVVGIDLFNEVWSWTAARGGSDTSTGRSTAVQTIFALVKAQLPSFIPVTASGSLQQNGVVGDNRLWGAQPAGAADWGFLDFHDVHVYYQPASGEVNASLPVNAGGKPLVLGEFGNPTEPDSTANNVAFLNANVSNAINVAGVTGGFFWVIAYTGVGLYDSAGTSYPTMLAAIANLHTTYP